MQPRMRLPTTPGSPTVVAAAADAAAVALDKTTGQLDVLARGRRGGRRRSRAAGTAGRDERHPDRTCPAPRRNTCRLPPHDHIVATATSATPQFEVMYLLSGCDAAGVETLRRSLDRLGESVAIATTAGAGQYSVHVHADDAGAAVEAALSLGTLSRIQITSLTGAASTRPSGGWARERAVLAVVDGSGAEELFAGEGAQVLQLDARGPVSAKDLLHALVNTGAAQVMVLPNGYVAAEELVAGCTAAIGWGIDVVPVPTASMVQGLAALAMHEADRQAVDDGYTMARAAAGARHGSVRVATEEALTWAGACEPGDGLGIAG